MAKVLASSWPRTPSWYLQGGHQRRVGAVQLLLPTQGWNYQGSPSQDGALTAATIDMVFRRKPIRDIITWVQCFAVFMAAVHKQDQGAVKELLAYMFTIIREFKDPAWRNYDEAFREKAAATGNRKWSEIDTLIYNRIFTGHARN